MDLPGRRGEAIAAAAIDGPDPGVADDARPGSSGGPDQAVAAAQRNREAIPGADGGGADPGAEPGRGGAKRIAFQEIDVEASSPLQGDRRAQHAELTLRHPHPQPAGARVTEIEPLIGGQVLPQFERHLHQIEDRRMLDLKGERAGIGARGLAPGLALLQDDDPPAPPGQDTERCKDRRSRLRR